MKPKRLWELLEFRDKMRIALKEFSVPLNFKDWKEFGAYYDAGQILAGLGIMEVDYMLRNYQFTY